MRATMIAAGLLAILIGVVSGAVADETPITGSVKTADTTKKLLIVEASARGKTRLVEIDIIPETKIIRFTRAADGKGFGEQPAALEDLRPGWTVTVKTNHHGNREVAETVRVVHER